MTLRQQEILAVLRCGRESKWTMSELAKELDISAAATSKMLTRLERQGKIQRCVDPQNRRTRLIHVVQE